MAGSLYGDVLLSAAMVWMRWKWKWLWWSVVEQ